MAVLENFGEKYNMKPKNKKAMKFLIYVGEMLSDVFVNSCMRETMMATRLVWVC